jgi:hypothetical protein
VYIDPYYVNAFTDVGSNIPGSRTPGIPRRGLLWVANNALLTRWFTLLDDLTFTSDDPATGKLANGLPETSGAFVKRGGRYTWAFLVKPARLSSQEVVDLSVVVYSGRAIQVPNREPGFLASGTKGDNTLTVIWNPAGDKPAFRKGVWLLDVTYDATATVRVPHGDFYRVVGSTDLAPGQTQLEIQGTLKADLPPPAGQNPAGAIVLMEQVVEVFDRGSGWKP